MPSYYLTEDYEREYLDNKLGQHRDYVMNHIDYFKLQAKNLHRDYKTRTSYTDKVDGNSYYTYAPQFFDIGGIFLEYDWDEESFSLMKAQHLFAIMLGFGKWADLLKASEAELELAKLLWDNQHKIHLEDWEMYIARAEDDNKTTFSTEDRIEIFKHVFANVEGHSSPFGDYRLNKNMARMAKNGKIWQPPKDSSDVQITSLPLSGECRAEFINIANSIFESILERIEPDNLELTRKLWDVEDYVNTLLTLDMLPISKDYALSLIDALLVHYVIGLAVEADKKVQAHG